MIFYLPVQECKLFCAFIFQLWEPLIGMFNKFVYTKKWINHWYIRETTLGKNVYWMFIFFFFTVEWGVVNKEYIYWSFLQLLFKVSNFSLNLIDFMFGHIFMLIFDFWRPPTYTSIKVKWTYSLFFDFLVHFLNDKSAIKCIIAGNLHLYGWIYYIQRI